MDKVYFLNLDIAQNLAGVESSALARSKLFSEHLGITPVFVTNVYNWTLHKNKQRVQANKRAAADLVIINMYDFFQEATNLELREKKLLASDLQPFRTIEVPGTTDVRLYDEKGDLIAYCKRHPDDLTVSFINYLKDGFVWRRETYDSRGFLSKVELLEKKDDSELGYESFLRPDGTIAITKRSLIKNGLATTLSLQLISKGGRLVKQFSSDAELLVYWLELLVVQDEKSIFVVDRCAEFYAPLQAAIQKTQSKAKVVSVVHSVHTAGDIYSGVVNKFYKTVLEEVSRPDAIIVCTENQKLDITQRFGKGNILVIPHSHEIVQQNPGLDQRSRNTIVYAARFAPEKNHDFALQAFKKVIASVPNAELHLFGFGERRQAILDQIKELGLEKKVVVNDFVHDVGPIYQSAGLSILTSGVEGFCLGVMESLFYGCPVISFDIKYGPHSMIQNGINGFLVPFKDVDMLANQIIQTLSDEAIHKKLVENSAESVKALSHEEVAKKWGELLSSLDGVMYPADISDSSRYGHSQAEPNRCVG